MLRVNQGVQTWLLTFTNRESKSTRQQSRTLWCRCSRARRERTCQWLACGSVLYGAPTICMHAPVVRLLLRWRANQKVTAPCSLCAGDQCLCGQAFTTGLTPPEFAAARHMDGSEEIVGVLNSSFSTKRKRRGTPMKEHAAKAGVSLLPTPGGIRAPLADESPATNKKRLRQLQRHQTACRQLVDRADKRADEDSTECRRFRSVRRAADAARYSRMKEARRLAM